MCERLCLQDNIWYDSMITSFSIILLCQRYSIAQSQPEYSYTEVLFFIFSYSASMLTPGLWKNCINAHYVFFFFFLEQTRVFTTYALERNKHYKLVKPHWCDYHMHLGVEHLYSFWLHTVPKTENLVWHVTQQILLKENFAVNKKIKKKRLRLAYEAHFLVYYSLRLLASFLVIMHYSAKGLNHSLNVVQCCTVPSNSLSSKNNMLTGERMQISRVYLMSQ